MTFFEAVLERARAHAATGSGVLAVLAAGVSASLLDSITLASSGLYQLAILLIHARRLRPTLRIVLAVALLAPTPFLLGAAMHGLAHVQAIAAPAMLPALLCLLVAAVVRIRQARRTAPRGPDAGPIIVALVLVPVAATSCAIVLLATGAWQADAIVGITQLLVMLFGLLGRHLLQSGRLLD